MSRKPYFTISVNGSDATGQFAQRILSIEVTDNAGHESDTVTVELDDRGGSIAMPGEGTLDVAIGYLDGEFTRKGTFEIEEIGGTFSGERTMTITGKAAGKPSLKQSKTRSWDDQTVKQIATKIAGEHGLQPAIDSEIGDIKLRFEGQSEESDMHFLSRIAKRFDGLFSVKDGRLGLVKRGAGKSASGAAAPSISLTSADLLPGADYTLKPRKKYGKVKATYPDRESTKRAEVEHTVNGDGPTHTLRVPFNNEAEAKAAAKGKGDQLKRDEGSVSVSIPGDPSMVAEGTLELSECREGVDGSWTIESVADRIEFTEGEASGYVTTINGKKGKG